RHRVLHARALRAPLRHRGRRRCPSGGRRVRSRGQSRLPWRAGRGRPNLHTRRAWRHLAHTGSLTEATMALPSGLTTVTASGTWTKHDGVAASGSVSFVPTNPRLVYEPDPTVLVGAPVIVDMDAAGSVTAELVPTDSADILGGAWNYTVTVYFNNGPSAPDLRYGFSMDVLTAGGDIDLTDFAPPVDPPAAGETYVLSVNGFSGHIQVEAIVSDTWGSNFIVQGDFTAEQDASVGGDLTLASPVGVEVRRALSSVLSSGVLAGGEINVNALNPAAVDISATTGYVVDTLTTPSQPSVVPVTAAAQTVAL